MKSYSIRPIPLVISSTELSTKCYRYSMGRVVPGGVHVWFIEGASKNILVDSGASKEIFAAHGAFHRRDVQSLEQGLAKVGLKPEDIDLVIQTHLHWDHVALASKLSKAKFLVQKAELDFARNPHPFEPSGYDPKLLEGLNFEVIEGDYQVEEGINLWFTPGHAPGGQSVVINTAKGTAIIDSLCSIDENFNPSEIKAGLPVIAPATHVDVMQAYESLLRIKEKADILIPQHEVRFVLIDRIP